MFHCLHNYISVITDQRGTERILDIDEKTCIHILSSGKGLFTL